MKNQQLNDHENDEFKLLLDRTKTKLGNNAAKLAEEFVLRAQLDAERKVAGKTSIQEKISFVKMEYFLYAFTDAHRLMQQLINYGAVIRKRERQIKSAREHQVELKERFAKAAGDLSKGANMYVQKAKEQIQ